MNAGDEGDNNMKVADSLKALWHRTRRRIKSAALPAILLGFTGVFGWQATQGDQFADPAELQIGVLPCIGRSQLQATLACVSDQIDAYLLLINAAKVYRAPIVTPHDTIAASTAHTASTATSPPPSDRSDSASSLNSR